jgi:hypothetical protein
MVTGGELSGLILVAALSRRTADAALAEFAREHILSAEPVAALRTVLDQAEFSCVSQRAIARRPEAAKQLEALFDADFPAAFTAVSATAAEFEAWHQSSLGALRAPGYTTGTLDVLSADETAAATEFLRLLVHALAYGGCLLRGPKAIQPLAQFEFGDLPGGFARLNLFLSRLVLGDAAMSAWAISPREATNNGYLPTTPAFQLRRLSTSAAVWAAANGLPELSPGLYAGTPAGQVVIVGEGFLVGTTLEDSLKLTDPRLHTALPVDAFGTRPVTATRPLDVIAAVFDDRAFCIDPVDYLRALNRNVAVRSLGTTSTGRCLLCGSSTPGTRFCGKH